jgi:hypothetical protein
MNRIFLLLICFLCVIQEVISQCDPFFSPPLSQRTANYAIRVRYDHQAKTIAAHETLTWINPSPDTIREMRFYMYLNAFKNTGSTFLKGSGGQVFGENVGNRPAETWGWIRVDSIRQKGGAELTSRQRYIQPDDGNTDDQTVLSVPLQNPVLPGDTLVLHLRFSAKLPKTIVRSGYSKDDWALFVHWFPQAGVYEQDAAGRWGWNCHQFHRQTEFYADFGAYDVEITAAKHLVMGASGCEMSEKENPDGTITRRYQVDDVIDFAWVVYAHFEEYTDSWEHVHIRLLIPPEHSSLAPRYLTAIKQSLSYLAEHVGRYPFPIITVVDPPVHGLRSGMMEYPTLITAGSFYQMPAGIRTMESLAAHEFSHQYFMMMLASNEKEEPWLDEGFVTYFEDRIIDAHYNRSLIDLFGFHLGNRELTRKEYTGMSNPKVGSIARPGWEIEEGYKSLVYSKTATMLQTLQGLVGDETMDAITKTYFERWKFRHPRGRDFIAVANEVIKQRHGQKFGETLDRFFDPCLYGTDVCDYAVTNISTEPAYTGHGLFDKSDGGLVFRNGEPAGQFINKVTLHRLGELIFPVEVVIHFEDGSVKTETWDGRERTKVFVYETSNRVVAAHLDPLQKIYLDIDLNNNSMTLQPHTSALWKYAAKVVFWVQNLLQMVGFFV